MMSSLEQGETGLGEEDGADTGKGKKRRKKQEKGPRGESGPSGIKFEHHK